MVADELVALTRLAAFGCLPSRTGDVLTGLRMKHAIPRRIGRDDVRCIEQTTDLFERWDFLFGGGLSRNAVVGQLEWTRQLYEQTSSTAAVRRELQSAIARLGEVAGWMSFDAGDSATARRCWLFALHMAAEADDWPIRVNILMDMAREAVYSRRPHDGLDLIRLANAADDRLTATVQTAVHVVTARAHAAAGQRDGCLRHIGRAQDAFSDRDPSDDPGWIWYYDAAQLAGDCGHALYDLAMTGRDVDSTMRLLAEAARLHGPEAARSQAFAIVKLATLQMRHTDPVQAAATVAPVLVSMPRIRSRRLTEDLKTLRRITAGRDTPEAHDLRRALRNVLRTAA